MRTRLHPRIWLLVAALAAGLAGSAQAVDGVIEIDQVKAAGGGVTPGDAPGFPVSLDSRGSYRLTSDLIMPENGTTPQNTTAILVLADGVSIDLNGFSIIGNNSCSVGGLCTAVGTGFGVQSNFEGTVVSNGTVRGMGGGGVQLSVLARVERVTALNNAGDGIYVYNASLVQDCQTRSNRMHGINATDTVIVRNNIADVNGNYGTAYPGIQATGNGIVSGNTSNANGHSGIAVSGSVIAGASVVRGNTTNGNGIYGLYTGADPLLLVENTVQSNGSLGMRFETYDAWVRNLLVDNPAGCGGGTGCNANGASGPVGPCYLACNVDGLNNVCPGSAAGPCN